jgi:hypothetical protein
MKTFFIYLLLFIIAYYIVKAILRLLITLFPRLKNTGFSGTNMKDGELKFDKTNEKKKRFGKDIGEYIDYEEVKK